VILKVLKSPKLWALGLPTLIAASFVGGDLVANAQSTAMGVAPSTPTAAAGPSDSAVVDATPSNPSQPLSLTATRWDSGAIMLSWEAPASDGGTPLTDYVIEKSSDGINWVTTDDPVSTSTDYMVTGLTNGTRYYFRVTALLTPSLTVAQPPRPSSER
jgi:Fibronectin type III domain